jgi:transcriptional regulator with XRE-family HTH domain
MPRATIDPALAAYLKQLREERGFSQEAVAHKSGLTSGSYASIEHGRSAPAWATVRAIADALEISLAELAAAVEAS